MFANLEESAHSDPCPNVQEPNTLSALSNVKPSFSLVLIMSLLMAFPEAEAKNTCNTHNDELRLTYRSLLFLVVWSLACMTLIAVLVQRCRVIREESHIEGHIKFLEGLLSDFYEVKSKGFSWTELEFDLRLKVKPNVLAHFKKAINHYQPTAQAINSAIIEALKNDYDISQFDFSNSKLKVRITNKITKQCPCAKHFPSTKKSFIDIADAIVAAKLKEHAEFEAKKEQRRQEHKSIQAIIEKRVETLTKISSYSNSLSSIKSRETGLLQEAEKDLVVRIESINQAKNRTHAEGKLGHAAQQIVKLKDDIDCSLTSIKANAERQAKKVAEFETILPSLGSESDGHCEQLLERISVFYKKCHMVLEEHTLLLRGLIKRLDEQIEVFNKIRNHDAKTEKNNQGNTSEQHVRVNDSPPKVQTKISPPPTPNTVSKPKSPPHSPTKTEAKLSPTSSNITVISKDTPAAISSTPSQPRFFKAQLQLPSKDVLLEAIKTNLTEIRYMLLNIKSFDLRNIQCRNMFSYATAYNLLGFFQALWLLEKTGNNVAKVNKYQVKIIRHMLAHLVSEANHNELLQLANNINHTFCNYFLNNVPFDSEQPIDFSNTDFYKKLEPQWQLHRHRIVAPSACLSRMLEAIDLVTEIRKLPIIASALDELALQQNAFKMLIAVIGEHAKIINMNGYHIWQQLDTSGATKLLAVTIAMRNAICHKASNNQPDIRGNGTDDCVRAIIGSNLRSALMVQLKAIQEDVIHSPTMSC